MDDILLDIISESGVPKDDAEAVKWFRKSAEQDYAMAQYNLGVMYSVGNGVPEDDVEAMKWVRKAAEQGDASAQKGLGIIYYNARGVPKDFGKAYVWLNLAAASDSDAVKLRSVLEKKMTKEQIAEGQKLTREWLERKAKEKEQ